MAFERPESLDSLTRIAVQEVGDAIRDGRIEDPEFIEITSSFLHEQWLQENASTGISEEKNRPYGELSEDDKEQYRIIVKETKEALGKQEKAT